mmetsp:Transcript_17666/g.29763  ORF Transcript_17666/g.29763 Transcript_17666/m.29763 type:complete len:271 (+) Transcript_17666:960-1772(+)
MQGKRGPVSSHHATSWCQGGTRSATRRLSPPPRHPSGQSRLENRLLRLLGRLPRGLYRHSGDFTGWCHAPRVPTQFRCQRLRLARQYLYGLPLQTCSTRDTTTRPEIPGCEKSRGHRNTGTSRRHLYREDLLLQHRPSTTGQNEDEGQEETEGCNQPFPCPRSAGLQGMRACPPSRIQPRQVRDMPTNQLPTASPDPRVLPWPPGDFADSPFLETATRGHHPRNRGRQRRDHRMVAQGYALHMATTLATLATGVNRTWPIVHLDPACDFY